MSVLALLALACSSPDPDALLRAGKLDEALAAWTAAGGRAVPARHGTTQALAVRAPGEPWITMQVLVDFTEAAALLDAVPETRLQEIDLSFERWAPMAACTAATLKAPWRLAVGRTALVDDPDPHTRGRPFESVPYGRGQVVGTAAAFDASDQDAGATALAALFAQLDSAPPSHRVTLALTDPQGPLAMNLTRRNGAWWTLSATDARAAAALIVRCGAAP